MAEVNVNAKLSWIETAKRIAPGDKNLMEITEVMTEQLPMLQDIPWYKCNQLLSDKVNRRTSLPTGTWRKAYQGVASKASSTQTVTQPVALLEARSEIDEDIVDNSPDPKGTRRQEDVAFTEGLAQQLGDAIIEGTLTGTPEQFDGLQAYLNALSQTTVIDGGNSGGTSIYAVDWGPRTCYGFYPSAAANRGRLGLTINDKGREKVLDASDNPYYAWVSQFKWWCGLQVRDELSIGRIANINPTVGGSNTFDEDDLIQLLEIGHFRPASTRIYVNKLIRVQMRIKLKNKANVNFGTTQGLSGSPILTFADIPVRRHDAIKTDESTVA